MRKWKTITIDADNRDKGKTFLLLEKPAMQTEKWGARAVSALSRHGIMLEDEFLNAGAAAVFAAGVESLKRLPFEELDPLMDEMLSCITFVPDAKNVNPDTGRPMSRPLVLGDDKTDGDIAEVGTLLKLRGEVLELHLGFSIAAVLSNMAAAVNLRRQSMSTSPELSDSPSAQVEPA